MSSWFYVHGLKCVYGYNVALHCGYVSDSIRIGSTVTAANCYTATDTNRQVLDKAMLAFANGKWSYDDRNTSTSRISFRVEGDDDVDNISIDSVTIQGQV